MAGFGLKAGASALGLALATLASPAAGQQVVVTVDYPTLSATGSQTVSERNLDEPVPPEIDTAAANATETFTFAAGTQGGVFVSTSRAEHRLFADEIVSIIDNRIGNPGDIQLRGILSDGLNLTVTNGNMNDARRELLLNANSNGRRHFAGTAVFTGGGEVVETDKILDQRLTGRDQVVATSLTIGGASGSSTFVIYGTRNNCPSAISTVGCEGGNRYDVLLGQQAVNTIIFTTLYITQSIERTLTGGTTFFDVPLTPLPSGAVHALAAQGALGGGQRFLDRLGDHAALVDGRGLWGDVEGVRQRFDGAGPLARSAADGLAIRLGFDLATAPGLTLGLAGEYASDDLAVADTITPESGSLDRWSLGAHARLEQGRVTASLAAMAGRVEADTSGASDLGAALGNYDATLYGLAARIGAELGDGPLRAIPEIGASWTMWDREAFAETGGPAPLAVAETSDQQTRLWGGGRLQWQGGSEQRRIALSAYGRAVRVTGDRTPLITAIDPQLPDLPMVTAGPTVGKTRAEYGANATLRLGAGTMELGWDGSSGNGADANTIRATVRIPF